MNAHPDLTWDELDRLVDDDTLKLRDVAWAEITWLRAQLAHERGHAARHLDYLLSQYDRLVQAHNLVVMDTPEDRELHARVVAEFRKAADPIRQLLEGGPTR